MAEFTGDDRILCTQCAEFRRFNQICGAVRRDVGEKYRPVQLPQRCEFYRPGADDANPRTGAERWPSLMAAYRERFPDKPQPVAPQPRAASIPPDTSPLI